MAWIDYEPPAPALQLTARISSAGRLVITKRVATALGGPATISAAKVAYDIERRQIRIVEGSGPFSLASPAGQRASISIAIAPLLSLMGIAAAERACPAQWIDGAFVVTVPLELGRPPHMRASGGLDLVYPPLIAAMRGGAENYKWAQRGLFVIVEIDGKLLAAESCGQGQLLICSVRRDDGGWFAEVPNRRGGAKRRIPFLSAK